MSKDKDAFTLYGIDFHLILLRQAERDLTEFQWRYRELADACRLVEKARSRLAIRRTHIENSRKLPQPQTNG